MGVMCLDCGADVLSFEPHGRYCKSRRITDTDEEVRERDHVMSFSVSFIGKPEAIKRKLAEYSERLADQSKEEFDAVRPALETLLDQNVGNGVVLLSANGHATFSDPNATPSVPSQRTKTYGQCSVEVKTLGQIAE